MSHYTLAWHDSQDTEQYICEYANDAFEAVINAREDVPYLHEHPFCFNQLKRRIEMKVFKFKYLLKKHGGYSQLWLQ